MAQLFANNSVGIGVSMYKRRNQTSNFKLGWLKPFRQQLLLQASCFLLIMASCLGLNAKDIHSIEQLALAMKAPVFTQHQAQASELAKQYAQALLTAPAKQSQALAIDLAKQLDDQFQTVTITPELNGLQQELLLTELLTELRNQLASDQALMREVSLASFAELQPTLEALTRYQAQHFVTMPDGGHQIKTPAANVAGAARALIKHLDVLTKQQPLLAMAVDRPNDFIAFITQANTDKPKDASSIIAQINAGTYAFSKETSALSFAAFNVLKALDKQQFMDINEQVNSTFIQPVTKDEYLPLRIHQLLAEQSQQLASYQLFAKASEAQGNYILLAQSLMRLTPEALLADEQQIQLFTELSAISTLTSLSIEKLSHYLDQNPMVETQLVNLLMHSQAHGGAAAKALASSNDNQLLSRLNVIAHGQFNQQPVAKLAQSRALLALYLNGSEQAREYLYQFATSPKQQRERPDLVKVVNQWLN